MKAKPVLLICFVLFSTLVFPREYKRLYLKGVQLGINGEFQQSRNYFERSLQANSFFIKAKRALDLLNDLDGMMVPPDAAKLLFKGILYNFRMEDGKALGYFQQARDLAPDYYYAHHNVGMSCYEMGRLDSAIDALKTATSLNPGYPYTHNNLGLAYHSKEMYQQALSSYQTAIGIDPEYYKAYNNMGYTYSKMKEYVLANNSYSRALKINPDYTLAFYNFRTDWQKFIWDNSKKMAEFQNQSADQLIDVLKRVSWKERVLIIMVLQEQNHSDIMGVLDYSLNDKNPFVRNVAVRLVAKSGDESFFDRLVLLLKDPDWNVRYDVVWALYRIGGRNAVPYLIGALKDKGYHVVFATARLLGFLEDPAAVNPLIGVLNSGHFRVRRNAAWALSKLGDRRAVPPLIKLLRDPHSEVREWVQNSLFTLTGQNFGADAHKWEQWYGSQGGNNE